MVDQKPVFLLTGSPGIGKSTAIMRLLACLPLEAGGFYTREIRKEHQRVGFEINTLQGEVCRLAEKSSISLFDHEVDFGAYKVNLEAIESVAVPAMVQAVNQTGIVIIDEIGPMEIFSPLFCKTLIDILNNPNILVIGTIVERSYVFADQVKTHHRVIIEDVTLSNRELLPEQICAKISQYLKEN